MGEFRYRVLQKDGNLSNGTVEGATRGEAMRRLNEQGMQVLSLEEEKRKSRKEKKSAPEKEGSSDTPKPRKPSRSENRLSTRQMIQFTEEMSDLLSAGVQLDTALKSIASRSETESIRRVATECYEKVRDGVP
ncbi:MAG: type II secretion system F family protein, partial [Verrucomicrobiota bacterium]